MTDFGPTTTAAPGTEPTIALPPDIAEADARALRLECLRLAVQHHGGRGELWQVTDTAGTFVAYVLDECA